MCLFSLILSSMLADLVIVAEQKFEPNPDGTLLRTLVDF